MNKIISDLGAWLGADITAYMKIRKFMEGIKYDDHPTAVAFKTELTRIHSIFERVVNDD